MREVTEVRNGSEDASSETGTSRRSYLKAAGTAGAIGFASMAGCVGGFGGGAGPVVIGTAFPYTGPYGASAEKQRDGVDLAVKQMNENGGLLDREVETVDRDTELNPDVNARRIRDLLYEEEVDLLIANLSGGITTQTQALAAEAGVPYMTGSRTSPPFHLPSSLGEASYAAEILNISSTMKMPHVAFEEGLGDSFFSIMADYGFNLPHAWEFVSNYIGERGGEVAGSVRTPLGNNDYSSAITDAMDSGADVLLAMCYGVDFSTLIQQAVEFNIKDEMTVITLTSGAWLHLPADPAIWEDIHVTMSWNPILEHDANDSTAGEFNQMWMDEYGTVAEDFGAVTYTGAKELERAVRESGGLEPSDVAGVLDGSTFSSYTQDGDSGWRACDNQILKPATFVLRGKSPDAMGERGDWDLVELVGSYDPQQFLPGCSYFEGLDQ